MKKVLLISIILSNIFCLSANATFIEKQLEDDIIRGSLKPTYTPKQIEAIYNCKYLGTSECYEELLRKIENDWIRKDYAITLFNEKKYDEAEEEFERLYRKHKNEQYRFVDVFERGYKEQTFYDPNNFARDSKIYLKKIRKIKEEIKFETQEAENIEQNMSISQ